MMVYLLMWICACVHVGVHVYGGQRLMFADFPQLSPLLFFEIWFLAEPKAY